MTTTLSIFALLIIISTLYFLQDTITEALSGGKSFLPYEMKSHNDGRTFKSRKATTGQKQGNGNRLTHVLIDTLRVIIILYIFVQVGAFILRQLHFLYF